MKNIKLVLLRHGESIWNKENRFAGWTDVDLTPEGVKQAREAGKLLKKKGFEFDLGFTSILKRGVRTLKIVLKEMDLSKIPVSYSWRLNEKHYGDLQGKKRKQMVKKFGYDQVFLWRREFNTAPPSLEKTDPRYLEFRKQHPELEEKNIPLTESLRDVQIRALPYWEAVIVPQLKKGKRIVISAHGNSIRALVKYLDKISDKKISFVNIPIAIPLVYEFDQRARPVKHYYLGDSERVKKEIKKVEDKIKV